MTSELQKLNMAFRGLSDEEDSDGEAALEEDYKDEEEGGLDGEESDDGSAKEGLE